MVPNPVPNNLTGIEVFFSILTFSILNSMLPFSMSPFFRCCRFDVPVVFFDVLVFDIPVFSRTQEVILTVCFRDLAKLNLPMVVRF